MRLLPALIIIVAAMLGAQERAPAAEASAKKVHIIPIRKGIDSPLVYLVRRGVKEAIADHADLLVRHGEVEWQGSKLHTGQRFAVMFVGFRASVVGTRFWVRQSSDGSDGQVQVSEGAVRVDAADDPTAPLAETTTVVRAGQRWRHTGGIMSLEPTQAVAAPHAVTPQSDEAGAVTGSPAVAAPAAMATRGTAHGKPRAAGSAADPDADRHILIEVPPQTMPPPEQPGEAGGR